MKKIVLAVCLFAALLATLGVAFYHLNLQQKTIQELTDSFALEKEQMEDEYSQLALQYEGYKLEVNNDSLEQKLEDQRIKMQRLVEELRQTRAQDAAKIASLRKELATVREAMRYYIAQVDSLNRVNEALAAENDRIRTDMAGVKRQNERVKEENAQLSKKVSVAAQLTASNFMVYALDKKDRIMKKNHVEKLVKFQVDFTIGANVTAEVGEKTVYLRLLRPSEEVLTGSQSGAFSYQGTQLEYSASKVIEYGGEELPVSIFYKRSETLEPGSYVAEIFVDGRLIGRSGITLKK